MTKTAIFKDDLFLAHRPGVGHVESPERLSAIYARLLEHGPDDNLFFPEFAAASGDVIAYNHSREYIEQIAATAGQGFSSLDPDTQTSADSYAAACLAVGAVVRGVEMLINNEADNAFALVRPPGHHAENDRAMGFCLLNNVAVAAHYAINDLGLERVMIIDWDLHHGNGTQHAFYDTDQVLYFSTHQYPYYPGTGSLAEVGDGKGEGYTVNVPLSGGQGDAAYGRIFTDILAPIVRQYKPQLIIVSAGFDIYHRDPLGGMGVTEAGFAYMSRVILDLAAETCEGRVLMALEGGYDLQGLAGGVMACLVELSGRRENSLLTPVMLSKIADMDSLVAGGMDLALIEQAKKVLGNYWSLQRKN